MKALKSFFILIIIFLLLGCADRYTQTEKSITTAPPTLILPTPTIPFLDFDNPRLHEIAENKPLVIDELVRTSIQNTAYVAVIVETNDTMLKNEMLLFQVKENISTLVYDLEPHAYMTFNIANENHPFWLLKEIPPIGIPVYISNGGNCYDCRHIVLINITRDGKAKDVTPATNFVIKGFVYLTGSGKAGRIELVGTRYYEWDYGAKSHVSSPFAFLLFEFNGTTYIDVSKDEKDFFDEKTSEYVNEIKSTYEKPFTSDPIMPLISEVFFNYESSGRVDYGWEQIESLGDLSHWNIKNTPPEEIKIYHDVFNQLEQRKNQDNATSTP